MASLFYWYIFSLASAGIYAKNVDPIKLTTIQLLTAGIFASTSALIFEPSIKFIDNQSMLGILYIVIFNTTIAFLVQNVAQKYTSDTRASIIISLEALFACLLAILLLGEVFTTKMILGAILIFIAVGLPKVSSVAFNLGSINE